MDSENFGSPDYDWCTEFGGYLMDEMLGNGILPQLQAERGAAVTPQA